MIDYLTQLRIGWLMIAEWWRDKLTEVEEKIEELFLCPGYLTGYAK